jgi:quinol monooxygenase YgiN
MLAIAVTLKVQDGKGPEFEGIFRTLMAEVRAKEQGRALFYQLTKSQTEANTYKMYEFYKDEDAFKQHVASDHFKAAAPKFGALLAGRPDMEKLDGVV